MTDKALTTLKQLRESYAKIDNKQSCDTLYTFLQMYSKIDPIRPVISNLNEKLLLAQEMCNVIDTMTQIPETKHIHDTLHSGIVQSIIENKLDHDTLLTKYGNLFDKPKNINAHVLNYKYKTGNEKYYVYNSDPVKIVPISLKWDLSLLRFPLLHDLLIDVQFAPYVAHVAYINNQSEYLEDHKRNHSRLNDIKYEAQLKTDMLGTWFGFGYIPQDVYVDHAKSFADFLTGHSEYEFLSAYFTYQSVVNGLTINHIQRLKKYKLQLSFSTGQQSKKILVCSTSHLDKWQIPKDYKLLFTCEYDVYYQSFSNNL